MACAAGFVATGAAAVNARRKAAWQAVNPCAKRARVAGGQATWGRVPLAAASSQAPEPLRAPAAAAAAPLAALETSHVLPVGRTSPVRVAFLVPDCRLKPGERLQLVGSCAEAGEWSAAAAQQGGGAAAATWAAELALPPGHHQFKLVCIRQDGSCQWEEGLPRSLHISRVASLVAGSSGGGGRGRSDVALTVTCHLGSTPHTTVRAAANPAAVQAAAAARMADLLRHKQQLTARLASLEEGVRESGAMVAGKRQEVLHLAHAELARLQQKQLRQKQQQQQAQQQEEAQQQQARQQQQEAEQLQRARQQLEQQHQEAQQQEALARQRQALWHQARQQQKQYQPVAQPVAARLAVAGSGVATHTSRDGSILFRFASSGISSSTTSLQRRGSGGSSSSSGRSRAPRRLPVARAGRQQVDVLQPPAAGGADMPERQQSQPPPPPQQLEQQAVEPAAAKLAAAAGATMQISGDGCIHFAFGSDGANGSGSMLHQPTAVELAQQRLLTQLPAEAAAGLQGQLPQASPAATQLPADAEVASHPPPAGTTGQQRHAAQPASSAQAPGGGRQQQQRPQQVVAAEATQGPAELAPLAPGLERQVASAAREVADLAHKSAELADQLDRLLLLEQQKLPPDAASHAPSSSSPPSSSISGDSAGRPTAPVSEDAPAAPAAAAASAAAGMGLQPHHHLQQEQQRPAPPGSTQAHAALPKPLPTSLAAPVAVPSDRRRGASATHVDVTLRASLPIVAALLAAESIYLAGGGLAAGLTSLPPSGRRVAALGFWLAAAAAATMPLWT